MGETATVEADQHLRALERANRVRLARAEMKREIADGKVSVSDVVIECPWQAHSMAISDLLMSQKRWGRARCRRLLTTVQISENKQVGTLTERQRGALAEALRSKRAAARPARERGLRALTPA